MLLYTLVCCSHATYKTLEVKSYFKLTKLFVELKGYMKT